MPRLFFVPSHGLFLATLVACGGGEPPEHLSDCDASSGDEVELSAPVLDGDTLSVEACYSGGCEDHEFALCWDHSFAESEPVQVWVDVWHDAKRDSCKAYICDTLSFDLEPLKQAWQDGYQADSGTMTVHVAGESLEYSF